MVLKNVVRYAVACAAVAMGAFLPLAADEVWVSDLRGNDMTGNGSYLQPYKTIQKGVDEAAAGDTVKILAGTYGEGEEHWDGSQTNRVVITKQLTLEGVEGKEVTHIVGRHQPGATTDKGKMGTAAIRCIRVKGEDADGTIIKGLTIRDGAVQNSSEAMKSYGGGVCGHTKDTRTCFYLVDCVVSNCAACWGGAIHSGTAVRCLFKNNYGIGPGGTARQANLLNCLVARNKNLNTDSRPALGYCIVVNSTVFGTLSKGMGMAYQNYVYNTISFANASTDINAAGTGTSDNKTVTNSYNTAAYAYTLFSPASGDCRITEGSPAAGGGLTEFVTSKITLPAGIEANFDLAGNRIDLSQTTCDAGCYQGAVTPAGGRIMFLSTGWIVNGERNDTGGTTVYYTPETWPISVTARPLVDNVTNYVYSATSDGYFAHNKNRRYFPLMDGSHVLTPPPSAADTLRLTPTMANLVVYAKPDANAAEADGTIEHPFRTLQDAIVCVTNSSKSTPLILALPGTYDEGGEEIGGVFTRLVIPDSKTITVRSTDGAERTVIKGGVDESNTGYYAGCGPAAVRCIHISRPSDTTVTPSAVQGFTIADGHTLGDDYNTDTDPYRGGGILGKGKNTWVSQVLDCIITNCAAVRCGASYNVTMFRCKLYDCHGYGGVMRSTRLISCYVDPSCTLGSAPSGASENCILGNSTTTYLTTAPEATAWNSTLSLYSSLFASLDPRTTPTMWGSVTTNKAAATSTKGCAWVRIPNFADPANNDWRLRTTTPARTECKLPAKDDAAYSTWAVNLAYTFQGDIEGRPMSVTDGKPLPGCWQTTVGDKGVFVSAKDGGLSLNDGYSVDDPASFPIAVSPGTGTRPCIGYEVDGATNLFETGNCTVTAADVAASEHGLILYAIYSNDWYVDPRDGVGDDVGNTGFLPSLPMKTLAAVMAKVQSGDTVHAAKGTYAEGEAMTESTNSPAWRMRARVVVPNGVTLVADEGPDETFIVGAPEYDSTKTNAYFMGTNAMRCVYMRPNARLKGFTVTGGRTWWNSDGFSDTAFGYSGNWSGGGICGHSGGRDDVYVEDCIISNNYACWAGGSRFTNLIRCRLFENYAMNNGGALRDAHAYGCVIDRCYSGSGSNRATCYYYTRIVGSTLGPHNYKLDGSAANAVNGASSGSAIFHDNLVLGSTGAKGSLTNTVTGCVFADSSNNMPTDGTCIVVPGTELEVDDDLRPIVGRNAAVDRGSIEALTTHTKGLLPSDKDALGFQRVMNGTIDVGALEGDWRPMYAKILDGKGTYLQVTAADSGVVTNDVDGVASVALGGGDALALTWGTPAHPAVRRGKMLVTGEGTLTVTLNGETFAAVTSADGVVDFAVPVNGLSTLDFAFAFAGEGSADLYGFSAKVGAVFSIR